MSAQPNALSTMQHSDVSTMHPCWYDTANTAIPPYCIYPLTKYSTAHSDASTMHPCWRGAANTVIPLSLISADIMQYCSAWCSHDAPLLTWCSEHSAPPPPPAPWHNLLTKCSTAHSDAPTMQTCWHVAANIMIPPLLHTSADLMQHCTQWCSHNASLLTWYSEHNDSTLIAYISCLNAALHTVMLPQCTPADMLQRTHWSPLIAYLLT